MRRAVRPRVKDGIGVAALLPGPRGWVRRELARSINVVYYHYVGPPAPFYSAFDAGVDVRRLDHDLRRLARTFHFAPLADVLHADGTAADGRPMLAISFDDGFDMLTGGVPEVLRAHHVSATVFAITGCLDNRDLMWRNKLSAVLAEVDGARCVAAYNAVAEDHGLATIAAPTEMLRTSRGWPMAAKDELAGAVWERAGMPPLRRFLARHRPYFTWDGLQRWLDAGHGVGLHTRSHPDCGRLAPEEVVAEIVEPAAQLRARLGLSELPLSYPFGSRLAADGERQLVQSGVVNCALGSGGVVPARTPAHRLDRADAENAPRFNLFGRVLLRSIGAGARRLA